MFMMILEEGGAVLWAILAAGVIAFIVFVERSLSLHRARIRWEDFLKGIFNILERGNVREALTICGETPGPVAAIARTAIQHREQQKEELRTALQDASLAEVSRMERRLVVIVTVAHMAPLLGLLGTVLAMVESTLVVQQQIPLVQSADMVSSMLLALITTAAGLTVAIPCYAAFNLLIIKIDRLVLDMERASLEILAFLKAPDGTRGGMLGSTEA
jgi:biopolymer transport protein ExbB